MAFRIDNGKVGIWLPGDFDCPFTVNDDITIEAHNVEFERCVWETLMYRDYDWPTVPFRAWRCSAATTAAMSLPRDLGGAGSALRLATVKNEAGKRIMMKLTRPRKPTKNNPAIWNEDPEDFKALYKYCQDDVRAETALSESPSVYPLSRRELAIWRYDQKINARGIPVDMESVNAAISLIGRWTKRLDKQIRKVTNGAATGRQVAKLKEWIGEQGVWTPSLDKVVIRDLLKTPGLPPNVQKVLIWRQSLSKASTAKLEAISRSVSLDGRVRGTMLYHGAGTGRWAGRRVQPQNLPQSKGIDQERALELIRLGDAEALARAFGDPMTAISRCIRAMIAAPRGRKFFGGDFSKIELVILVWLTGQLDVLKMLREGEDIYVYQAADIFGMHEWEVGETERDIGKRGVLGCGYGCGAYTFKEMVKVQADQEISEKLAERVVNSYRKKFPKVVRYWYAIEECVMQVVRNKKALRHGRVVWGIKGDYLHCTLPSGRLMSYYKPEIQKTTRPWGERKDSVTYMGMDSYSHKWTRQNTYGGKLTENIVQAIARDVLAEAILRAEKANYHVIAHVHDEILSEVDEDFGSAEEFGAIMSELPAWLDGCPIKVEAWEGRRYKK